MPAFRHLLTRLSASLRCRLCWRVAAVVFLSILLVEAAMLGAIGAGIGIALALLVVLAANAIFLGSPFAFTTETLLYLGGAVVFGIATSLIAGAYPAWRAASERPVEALRG